MKLVEFKTLKIGDTFKFDEDETLILYIKTDHNRANYIDGINPDFEVSDYEEVVIDEHSFKSE